MHTDRTVWPHTLVPVGDRALTIDFTDVDRESIRDLIRCLDAQLRGSAPLGVTAVLPAIRSLTVHYDAMCTTFDALCDRLSHTVDMLVIVPADPRPPVTIQVCYGGEFGPDLEFVASIHEMSADAIIDKHCATEYVVAMIGFLPGFPYLEGLDDSLHTPRRDIPRTSVPAGSVGIGGSSTGVYPFASPGGWHLIGRTPRTLFDARRVPPALLQAGDRVRFVAITPREWQRYTDAA